MLTEAQKKLIELDLKKEEITKYYEELDATLALVRDEVGCGGHFQADDGTVFKVTKPTGRFVTFKELDYVRTKRDGEERGTLSVKEAETLGYKVKK